MASLRKRPLMFFNFKGQPLHQDFKEVVWSIIGDHEYFSSTLGLPHWYFIARSLAGHRDFGTGDFSTLQHLVRCSQRYRCQTSITVWLPTGSLFVDAIQPPLKELRTKCGDLPTRFGRVFAPCVTSCDAFGAV